MSKSEYKEALKLVEELHPSAHVLAKAATSVRDPNVEVGDLETILKSDPSITADVIKMSNSAYYSYATPSKDLSTSISRIGFDELLKLIGLSISKNLFNNELYHYAMTADEYWSECVATALSIESFARMMNIDHAEAYTVGLLATVGKIVINQTLLTFGEEVVYCNEGAVHEWEQEHLGFNNGFAGCMLLRRWEFPPEIIESILHQYKVEGYVDPAPILQALYFSRRLIDQAGHDFSNENLEIDEYMEEFLEKYMITEDDLVNCICQSAETLSIIRHELGMN